ncbi:MAG: CRISPR-associated endonuclease Cas1 [Ktedonobacterales bacterium]
MSSRAQQAAVVHGSVSKHYTDLMMPKNGILVLTGYGLRVAVERGQLTVADGIGPDRRQGAFSRATCGIKRLVVLGHSGTISFEALRWLQDVGSAVVQIDADGNVIIAAGAMGFDDVHVRRAQALAFGSHVGVNLARDLLQRKLVGQAQVLARFSHAAEARATLEAVGQQLDQAKTFDQLRLLEAQAAVAYWDAWTGVEIRFAKRDLAKIPEHWRSFGTRKSPVSGTARRAANPANALLNYLYAILEAEARIAALTLGLDPGMGVLHVDQRNRDSLACDLMEAVRPQVDALVLDLLGSRTFTAKDFFETRQGDCRVLPPMTAVLAEAALQWAKLIAPVAEDVAKKLTAAYEELTDLRHQRVRVSRKPLSKPPATQRQALPTPLSGANRRAGRDRQRTQEYKEPANPTAPQLTHTCIGCGAELSRANSTYCEACLIERREEYVPAFLAAGPEVLAELRAVGQDPAHGGEAAAKRAAHIRSRTAALAEWKANHDRGAVQEPELDFRRDILPDIREVSLTTLMQATGLSLRYCWLIKTGQKTPHPRHWQALQSVSNRKM